MNKLILLFTGLYILACVGSFVNWVYMLIKRRDEEIKQWMSTH